MCITPFRLPPTQRNEGAIAHTRSTYAEEKAKVVAASWGTELLQFLAAPAIFPQDELKKRLICTLFLQLVPVKISLLFKSSQIK